MHMYVVIAMHLLAFLFS